MDNFKAFNQTLKMMHHAYCYSHYALKSTKFKHHKILIIIMFFDTIRLQGLRYLLNSYNCIHFFIMQYNPC